jgi:multidrug efflux pump
VQVGGDRKFCDAHLARCRQAGQLPAHGAGRRGRAAGARTSRYRPGSIESRQREFSVTARTDLNTVAQFNEITLKTVSGFVVRLRDVARVEEGPAPASALAVRLNGVPSISTGIIRNATANPLEVAAGVKRLDAAAAARVACLR